MNRSWLSIACLLLMSGLFALQSKADEPTWQLAMNDADIRDVVREVGSILRQTIVLDPRVQGRVTVHSNAPLEGEEVRRLFYSVLNAQGFSAINDGERLLIVPGGEAKTWANQQASGLPDAMTTRVFELSSSVAADIAGLLRPLVSSAGYVGPSASANALVITDSAANLERLGDLVEQLDAGQQHEFSLVQLKHATANNVVTLVSAATDSNRATHKVLADPSGNRVLVLGSSKVRQKLVRLVQAFDTPSPAGAQNWRVIRLDYGDAGQLAKVMGEIGKGLTEPAKADSTGKSELAPAARIEADESQNALVLVADSERLRTLEQIVRELDQPRAQVLIQAAIVEVSGDISQSLGLQWGVNTGSLTGAVNFPGAGVSLPDLLSGAESGVVVGAGLAVGTDRFAALISALASDTRNNLLSTPSLLTLDNQDAEILVGQNVPFQTGSYTTSGSGADNPFTTVERKDVGISLKIRPHINEGRNLRLEVEQESSEVVPGLSGADIVTNKRVLKSTILAEDGQIIVVGGLIKDGIRRERSEVPGLGRLPWIGGLFRWSRDTQIKTNLMVFLRPTIIRTTADRTQSNQRQYDRLRQDNTDWLDQDPRSLFEAKPEGGR
jgi:general secretion pathway protein D